MRIFTQIILALNTLWFTISPTVNSYTEGVIGQPRSFLPSQAETKNDVTISRLIFRGLFKYDIYGSLVPELAETWQISDDGLVYTIKLKDNQFWSDGRKINSDDLIYTSFKVKNLVGVATDKVDDLTVRYTLPNKYSPFLSLLTIGVMPVDSEEKIDPLKPLSSGPFRIIRLDKNGPIIKQVILIHEDPKINIRKMIFRYYANNDELVTAAKLGEISGFLSDKEVVLDNFEKYKFPLQGVYYALFFNLRNEKMQDLELRKYIQKALPIEQIISDKGITVQGPISRSSFTDRSLDFNKVANKDFVIDQTKYADTTINITIPNIKTHIKLAEAIENILENELKVEVKIIEIDPEKMLDDVIKSSNFEILLYGQEVGRDPDRYSNWHSTQKVYPGLNLSGFEHVRADKALEEGRNVPENDSRMIHYNEFQKTFLEQIPAIFLYHPFTNYYISKYVTGVGDKYTFTISDRFLDYYNWKKIETN
ncbi:hypothetical protein A2V49_03805 [candidate division WWE3 bacterium RBG_19FT_COMBO_34_6]|uniref:Solute-binding protein family 5 domain-containing protein n=1 Tax=candidate division WWE3 bacterium RBG_19FT_COMBO_34_6 TaxID=1802612 RepID=A0A1F4UL66_UNCKA|nr:MAG: hypothetical protein A2V49_03805 [candidate division WWE3 bacterium RBG_19FT_COMBO_34_6]